jgi:hypothetical protein
VSEVFDHQGFASEYLQSVLDQWSTVSRLLIVVDGIISPSERSPFSLAKAIAALRGFSAGLARFEVSVATRNGPAGYNPDPGPQECSYTGFRFDQAGAGPPLGHYDQVWLFGHNPTNEGATGVRNDTASLDPALNAIVFNDVFNPLSGRELRVLIGWMNGGGGLFAAGDHHLLGASMCAAIPRVNTMRRWLISDELPTQYGSQRHQSTRPSTPEEWAGTAEIPDEAEEDATPQPVFWVPEYHEAGPLTPLKAPHPILCHPLLGPINVLPDHMHEGSCYDTGDPAWIASHGEAVYTIGDLHGKQYPAESGLRPLPKVIAWGQTLASPPLEFENGPQPQRQAPLIVAYDGQQIELGRVVVDSTWHHWFDMNLAGLEAGDPAAYQKILRYYVNVAIWLAQPGLRTAMTMGGLKAGQFDYFGIEGAELQGDPARLGRAALRYLGPKIGPCWVRDFAEETIARIDRRAPSPTQPAAPAREHIRAVVLGEITKDLYSDQAEVMAQIASAGRAGRPRKLPKDPQEIAVRAAHRGLARVAKEWREALEAGTTELQAFSRAVEAFSPEGKGRPKG